MVSHAPATSKNASPHVALVTGARGIIGGHVVAHLASDPTWHVRAISREPPPDATAAEHLPLDLLDARALRDGLASTNDTTHLMFAAYAERESPADAIDTNVAMLRNALDALVAIAAPLEHVTLYQGGKAYGAHLGPYKTPAREDDPRLPGPNFYYDQEDLLRERAARDGFRFTILRPDAMIGIGFGNPMNVGMALAVYAAIVKELGLPLRFPGTRESAAALTQGTDAGLLARATAWAATTPAAAGEIFNVIDGDQFRWETLFPIVADDFAMPYAGIQPMSLATHMADKAPVWRAMVAKYGLRDVPYERMAQWPFADGQFNVPYDLVQSTIKLRHAGFADCVDTTDAFRALFARLRADRYLPPVGAR